MLHCLTRLISNITSCTNILCLKSDGTASDIKHALQFCIRAYHLLVTMATTWAHIYKLQGIILISVIFYCILQEPNDDWAGTYRRQQSCRHPKMGTHTDSLVHFVSTAEVGVLRWEVSHVGKCYAKNWHVSSTCIRHCFWKKWQIYLNITIQFQI